MLGYTGDGEKASWIKTDLNYDWAFNYKTQDLNQTLNIAAPNGVDIFWDGVGGSFSSCVLQVGCDWWTRRLLTSDWCSTWACSGG